MHRGVIGSSCVVNIYIETTSDSCERTMQDFSHAAAPAMGHLTPGTLTLLYIQETKYTILLFYQLFLERGTKSSASDMSVAINGNDDDG